MRRAAVVAMLVLGLAGVPASAAVMWTGSGTSALWSQASNWSTGSVPDSTDLDVVFSSTSATATTVTIDAPTNQVPPYWRTVHSLTFLADADVTIADQRIPQSQPWGTTHLRVSGDILLSPPQAHTYTVGQVEFTTGAHTVSVPTGCTLSFTGSGWQNIGGADVTLGLTGGGTVSFGQGIGAGTLDVQTPVVFRAGEFRIDRLAGSGSVTFAGGYFFPFYYSGGADNTWDSDFQGGTAFVKTGTGTLTVAGTIRSTGSWSSGLDIEGTLRVDNRIDNRDDRLGDTMPIYARHVSILSRIEFLGNASAGSSETIGQIWLGPSAADEATSTVLDVDVEHGAGANAVLTLAAEPKCTAGLLRFTGHDLGTPGTSEPHGRVMISGTLSGMVNGSWGYGIVGGDFASYDAVRGIIPLSESGRPTMVAAGTIGSHILVNGPQLPLSAATTINSLKINGPYDINLNGKTLAIQNGGIIKSGSASRIVGGQLCLPNNALMVESDADLEIAAALVYPASSSGWGWDPWSLTKAGAGKLTLRGTIAYSGGIRYLPFRIDWAEGDLTVGSASFITLSAGVPPAAGRLVKQGTGGLTLDSGGGDWLYSGGTQIDGGTLLFDAQANPGLHLGTAPVDINAGGTLDLWSSGTPLSGTPLNLAGGTLHAPYGLALAVPLSGGGSVVLASTAGPAGRLSIAGSDLHACGTAGSGQAGVMSIQGSLAFTGGRFCLDLVNGSGTGRPLAGRDYSQLIVTSTGGFGGTISGAETADLVISIAPGQNWLGDVLTVLKASSASQLAFGGVHFGGSGHATVTITSSNSAVVLTNIAYPGDADSNGVTDYTDYAAWFNNFRSTAADWAQADFDEDRTVDYADYATWFNHFREDQSAYGAAVPEPASAVILAACAAGFLRRRRAHPR